MRWSSIWYRFGQSFSRWPYFITSYLTVLISALAFFMDLRPTIPDRSIVMNSITLIWDGRRGVFGELGLRPSDIDLTRFILREIYLGVVTTGVPMSDDDGGT